MSSRTQKWRRHASADPVNGKRRPPLQEAATTNNQTTTGHHSGSSNATGARLTAVDLLRELHPSQQRQVIERLDELSRLEAMLRAKPVSGAEVAA